MNRGVFLGLAIAATIGAFLAALALGNAVVAEPAAPVRLAPWTAVQLPEPCKREALEVVVDLSHELHPAILAHERRALEAGERRHLVLERDGADRRRREALRGVATAPGMDRDEYPPAVSAQGGAGSDVALVPSSQNRSAGSVMGAQLRPFCDGQRFVVEATP